MEATTVFAKLNNLRMSPRKVMLVVGGVREKSAVEAQRILRFTQKKASVPVLKLLNSAVANAKQKGFVVEDMRVSEVLVGAASTIKRGRYTSRGGFHKIMKRTSNITITLEKVEKEKAKVAVVNSKG